MSTMTRRQKLRKLAEAHDTWVGRHLTDIADDFEPRSRKSDYNVHNVDVDADGAAQDELAAAASEIFADSPYLTRAEPLVADAAFEKLHPRDGDGQFTDSAGDFARRLAGALTGQAALNAVPATLKRAPRGQQGHFEGAELTGPAGVGSTQALAEYQGTEYQSTNTFLRGGYSSQSGPGDLGREGSKERERLQSDADRVAEIDKTLAVSPLQSDVRVQRAIRHGREVFGDAVWYGDMDLNSTDDFDEQDRLYERWEAGERPDLTGLRWVDHGYQSTTAREGYAEEFGGKWREYNNVSDGEPVIMNILVPEGTPVVQLSELEHEAEIMIDRGVTMEVVRDHGVGEDGFRRLDIRVVSQRDDNG